MPENEADEEVLRKLEDIEAKLSQLEDRVLTNELDFQELRAEVRGKEDSPTPGALDDKIKEMEQRLRKDLKDVEKWKDSFENFSEKLQELEEKNKELRQRIKASGSSEKGEVDKTNRDVKDEIKGIKNKLSEGGIDPGRIEEHDKRLEQIAEENKNLRDELNNLRRKVQNTESSTPSSPKQQDLGAVVSDLKERQEVLRKNMQKLNERMEKELKGNVESRISSLEQKVEKNLGKGRGKEIEKLKKEIKALKKKLNSLDRKSPIVVE